jgi:hypothetical protein
MKRVTPYFFLFPSQSLLTDDSLSQLMKNSYRNDDILIPSLASFSVYSIYPCRELCFSWLANANSGVATRPLWSSRWRSLIFFFHFIFFLGGGGKKKIGNMRTKILGIKKHYQSFACVPTWKQKMPLICGRRRVVIKPFHTGNHVSSVCDAG